MKKRFTYITVFLLVAAFAASLAGCGKTASPEQSPSISPSALPDSPPSFVQSQAPPASPSAETSPSQTPSSPDPSPPEAIELGLLLANEYYYRNGNNRLEYVMFFDNGTCIYFNAEGTFAIDNDEIVISVAGEVKCAMTVRDEFTLEMLGEDGDLFIRKGGGSVSNGIDPFFADGTRALFFDANYYLLSDQAPEADPGQEQGSATEANPESGRTPDQESGQESGPEADPGRNPGAETPRQSICFRSDGTVTIVKPEETVIGDYAINWEEILISVETQELMALSIQDCTTLIDVDTGDTFIIAGIAGNEFVPGAPYYIFGDEDDGYIRLGSDGTLEMADPEGGVLLAQYSVDESGDVYKIIFTYDGNKSSLRIINNYILEHEEGVPFIRLP